MSSHLDYELPEEIEVLVEEHEWLMGAAKEEISRSTSVDTLDNSFDGKDPAGASAPTKESIFVDKSINKSSHTEKERNSYFSVASDIVTKAFNLKRTEKYSQSPPPLSLAKTFDTEQSSFSGDEDRDHEGNSTTSDCDIMLMQDFSRMSATAIDTILEEQQRTQEEIRQAEIQREQKKIDEALQFLHDASESATFFTNDGTLEWLETEVYHAEMIADIAFEICNDDGSSQLLKVGNARGDNSVAIATEPSLSTTEEVEMEAGKKESEMSHAEDEGEMPIKAPPPSPIRKSKLLRQEEELNLPSIGTDQLPHDPTIENISVSKLLSFEEYPEEASVPNISYNPVSESLIVEDEMEECAGVGSTNVEKNSDCVEKTNPEDSICPPIITPEDKGPNRDVAIDEQETSEEAVSLPPPYQREPISTLDEKDSSDTISQILPGLTEAFSSTTLPMTEESAPMDELEFHINNSKPKPQKVRSSFGWFKLFCLVAMVSIVGAIGHLSDPSLDPRHHEIQPGFEGGQGIEMNSKNRNRQRREMNLDGFHAILW